MSCHVRESKTALDSGFRAMISRFQLLDSGSFFIRYWIPYSRLLELHSGFQIPPANISLPQAPEFPDFGSCERGEKTFDRLHQYDFVVPVYTLRRTLYPVRRIIKIRNEKFSPVFYSQTPLIHRH